MASSISEHRSTNTLSVSPIQETGKVGERTGQAISQTRSNNDTMPCVPGCAFSIDVPTVGRRRNHT
jgi:hypothetical protein